MKITPCYICGADRSNFLFKKGNYNIVECLNCSFVYVDSVPSRKQLNEIYRKFHYQNEKDIESTIRTDAIRSLKIIKRYVQKDGNSLLDVGCGRGYFLDEAKKMSWITQGIDYSEKVVDFAQKKFNLNVVCADIFHYTPTEQFDVITLNQVLEHVSTPHKLIQKCRELLKTTGIIYIATPNIKSFSAKILKKDFDHLIPPMHLGYFQKSTLINVLKLHNFGILYTGSWSYPMDLAGIIKRLLKRKKHSGIKSAFRADSTTKVDNNALGKKIKYFVFDKLFCGLFYRFLNFDSFGIVLEVIARKE